MSPGPSRRVIVISVREEKSLTTMKNTFDVENIEQQHALNLIEKSSCSIFLTGRAGTGKTTFLKLIQEVVQKNFLVLAPTGVAAINAGGQTIHSFFGFDTSVQAPGDYGRLNQDKTDLVRAVDTIIIDEVSMVRCDIVDAMDRTLRLYRENSAPFGGIQMIFAGDMFQLEPVVSEDDRQVLMDLYETGSFSFYKAGVIKLMDLRKIEFIKVYQQSDPLFLGILDRMRVGRTTPSDIRILNSRSFAPGQGADDLRIVLTSTKRDAQAINASRLGRLQGEEKTFAADYQGNYRPGASDVADPELTLKVGAQVMFIKNDSCRRWVNGTLGIVTQLGEDVIEVRANGGETYAVSRAQWEKIEYAYDRKTKHCQKVVVGTVSQFPLKLAWAITIHKSQSLTFDNVAVDFGRRAFGCGQAYVALSRSRSLQGLELLRPISLSSVLVSHDAMEFSRGMNDENLILREIRVGEALDWVIREQDFDRAVRTLFCMVEESLNEGDYASALDYFSRAMSLMIDDACIVDCHWEPIPLDSHDKRVMEAARLFYSGNVETSQRLLEELGVEIQADVNALYLLSRCHEEQQLWEDVEKDYRTMGALFSSLTDRGEDPVIFRKIRYRWAILNERVYHDDGIGLMRNLMSGNPAYPRYHSALRWMLRSNPEVCVPFTDNATNLLIVMVFNDSVAEGEFLTAVHSAWAARDERWNAYRKYINSLKLSIAD